ncbi:M48 family metalloprotease [Falsiroseomonas selenitidurans]|uniref:M48 family metalloprotease n=1 Tax=Falsiroseomonas selenitidurans TaxID=2716335 RepID=A0ABX1E3K0_9PROT|nr:M48 family metalloprotease [Falsiroseomonas selenitidurans]NKC31756.1 M48 family metalloprotease [Falsiroseomonas selenitidurans]
MLPTLGLRTHIWNTGLRTLLLLAGFPVLLALIAWAVALLLAAGQAADFAEGLLLSRDLLPVTIPIALLVSALWFGIAWLANQRILDAISGARPVTRQAEPELWRMTEELAISRGMRMPRLAVIETPARNAFASGLTRDKGAVTVTRGLLDALTPREVRAVLAHELTHIRNGDARLGVVAAVFAGVISMAGEVMWRGVGRGGWRLLRRVPRGSGSSGKGRGGAMLLVLLALGVAALAWVLSLVLRLALSRNREYLADAGAVEMTADPDAMVGALRKLEGAQAGMEDLPGQVRALLLHDGANSLGPGWFATHPPIAARVAALVQHAGARDLPKAALVPVAGPPLSPPATPSDGAPHSPGSSPPASPWWRQPPTPPAPG